MGVSGSSGTMEGNLTGKQRSVLKQLGRIIYNQLGEPGPVYTGDLVAGESPLQSYAFDQLMQAPALQGEYQGTLSNLLGGGPAAAYDIDPAARQGVYDAQEALAMRDWRQNILPTLEERYNVTGQGRSGGLEQALATSGEGLQLGLAGLRSDLEYQDEMSRRAALESGAQRQLQSRMAGAGAYQADPTGTMSTLPLALGAGEMQRGIAGEFLQEPYRQWTQRQPYANPWMQYLPQFLGTTAYTPLQSSWGFGL